MQIPTTETGFYNVEYFDHELNITTFERVTEEEVETFVRETEQDDSKSHVEAYPLPTPKLSG